MWERERERERERGHRNTEKYSKNKVREISKELFEQKIYSRKKDHGYC